MIIRDHDGPCRKNSLFLSRLLWVLEALQLAAAAAVAASVALLAIAADHDQHM
jgi:hypothetical protein